VTEAAQAPTQLAAATIDGKPISDKYRFYILILLAASFGLNMADRGLISTVMPAIKAEMHLTDTEVGFIAGPMFAFVYAAFGIPLATLADQRNRRTLIAFTTTVFSAATALSGFANSYVHLAMCRFLTGAGEAGTTPTGNSMIADLYPPEKRASAISIFTAGGSCGIILASLVGGLVTHNFGWRAAFLVAGVPGLVLALLIFFTMPEPARVLSQKLSAQRRKAPLWAVLKMTWSQPSFRWLVLADILLVFHNRGAGPFENIFLVQTHGFNLAQLGVVRSIFGVVGVVCVILIGRLVDRGTAKDLRWLVWTPAIVSMVSIPASLVLLTTSNGWLGLVINGLGGLVSGAYLAPMYASTQLLVPNAMRARSVAVLVTVAQIFGMGLGPVFAGAVSDMLAPTLGVKEGLRWSLIIMLIPSVLAILTFFMAARTFNADVARAKAMDAET
jgi:predicted MFS family arabinose efflux permease